MSFRTSCCKTLSLIFALLGMAILAAPAFAQTCLQDEYNKVQKQKLNCTANDVRIAEVKNITDPATGKTITTCFQGTTFNFIADFEVKTTSTQNRENIGLYIATASTTQALTGTCDDAIITAANSAQYHESDPAPDNCGDTSSSDFSPAFGAGTEDVRLEIDNFSCTAPAGSTTLVLPNCTSWQIPGGTIQCVSTDGSYPFNGPGGTPTAIPGTPSKCNCSVISLPITPVTITPIVQKACTTTNTPGPVSFTQNPNTASPTTCDAGAEGSLVTFTVAITNTSTVTNNNVVVDQICDSEYGKIFQAAGFTGSACPAGATGLDGTAELPVELAAIGGTHSYRPEGARSGRPRERPKTRTGRCDAAGRSKNGRRSSSTQLGDIPVVRVVERRQRQDLIRGARVLHVHAVSYGCTGGCGSNDALGCRCRAGRVRRRNRDAVRRGRPEGRARVNR